ncbi:MAG: 4a-hydroxytetrahydrobiopterin dehydratase [Candidatus Paceibacterota bacterium]
METIYSNKWINNQDILSKTFTFNDFVEAVNFVSKIVPLAEKLNHHPDIEIFSYNKVKVKLSTHDVGNKVTEKDIELSKRIDKIL